MVFPVVMYGCESESEVAQLCLTLCNSMDCSLSGSSVHWIFQERVLEWGAISFSRGSSQPRDRTWVSCIAGRHFTVWATREASACVCMWELDYKENWAPKNWCFCTVVLEKTLESPLDCKEIQPIHPNGDQYWVFIGRTDVEAETPILRPPDTKSWLLWKDPDAGKDWGQKEKGTIEDEMVGWHHQLNGHGFGWTPWVGDMDREAWCAVVHGVTKTRTWLSDWTELNWNILHIIIYNH